MKLQLKSKLIYFQKSSDRIFLPQIVYKLPSKSRQEIEAMFGLSELKQTKVYQEAFQEGEIAAKLSTVPRLLALGLTVEQIAQALELDVEQVRQAAQPQSFN